MADNTAQGGADTIATDELTLVNGVTQQAPLPKAQRVKSGFGTDGAFTDVATVTPLPVRNGDGTNQATVKAGNTPPVAGDTAEVVTLHPSIFKAVPAGGTGVAALPVWANAIQLATYTYGARGIATGALTANTAKQVLSLEVAATNTKTVKVRRIIVSGVQSALLAGTLDIQVTRGTAASTLGTAVTAGARVAADAAPQTVVKTLPTIVAAAAVDVLPFAANGAAAASAQPATVLYDWQEGGETKPWTLVPGSINSLVLSAVSTAAQNWTLTIHVVLTEE